jgi:hypothetical protein
MQVKRVLPFPRDATYQQRYDMLRSDELNKDIDWYAWRNAAMSEAERTSRTELDKVGWKYLKEVKFMSGDCDAINSGKLPCHGEWPFCPKCPPEFPDCSDHKMSHERQVELRRAIEQAWAADPRPVPVPSY